MFKQICIALLAAGTAMSALAQGTQAPKVVGKFANVTGLVTVSTADSLANAVNGASFAIGSRVVATASGGVTLKFDNGCDLTLKANESVTVSENSQCKLAALPSTGPSVVPAAGVGAGTSALGPVLLVGGAAIAVVFSRNGNNKTSGS